MTIDIRQGDLDDAQLRELIAHHQRTAAAETTSGSEHALDVDGLRHPDIRLWTAHDAQGALVGMGALKRIDAQHGELKSMHTVQAARGHGVGDAVLRHIVAAARADGLRRLSLETGSWAYFEPARRLYARHGFVPCAPFASYRADPNSAFMTLHLASV